MHRSLAVVALLLGAIAFTGPTRAGDQRILVQSTTSTQNSGLYDHLLPKFTARTGIRVDVVAVGTGQAIRNARAGDADVLLVHSKPDEDAFVEDGHGLERHLLMYNDFVVIGPGNDPVGVSHGQSIADALSLLAGGAAPFISRGDDSGTHKKERVLWLAAGLPAPAPDGWYLESGSGMGATIRLAVDMDAYTLTDRATWLSYERKQNHKVLFAGDPALFNQYSVIAVSPERHPHVNHAGARRLVEWLLSDEGQNAIASFRVHDRQLFFPNAASDN